MHYLRLFLLLGVCNVATCSLFFPTNSAYGIFAAIAVPLDLPPRNVFVSYNFEANYNLPATWGIPPAFLGIQDEELFEPYVARRLDDAANCEQGQNCTVNTEGEEQTEQPPPAEEQRSHNNATETEALKRARRSLLSRSNFYYILKDKFAKSGYQGEACLLRLICETNSSELGQVNGVLGSIVHILFSPSTSWYERLPERYYQAETDGQQEHCEGYEQTCGESLLDLISQPLHEILKSI